MKFIRNAVEKRKLLNQKWRLLSTVDHLERELRFLPFDLKELQKKQEFYEDRENSKTNPLLFHEVEKRERRIKNGRTIGTISYKEIVPIDNPIDRNATEIRRDEIMDPDEVEFQVNRIRREKDAVRKKIVDLKTEWATTIKELGGVNAKLSAMG